jgi:exo-beta-1,3-glucanase (GH17 family)/cellulose synthase/poly-beta-1,6-N-acetylglucosamine synthase-like glycosyltransferase
MKRIILAILLAAACQAAIWKIATVTVIPPDIGGSVASLSFSPFAPGEDPEDGDAVSLERLDHALEVLSHVTRNVRLYSSRSGLELVPQEARKYGMNVAVAAWLSGDPEEDRAEIERAVKLANSNWNVRSIYVGNEALLREEVTPDQLIAYIREVKSRVHVPVTTGEVWHVWTKYPQLVREVDYISAHLLPYWEGVPYNQAVAVSFERYDELRRTFPGKKVVIGEFGWPSQGYNFKAADVGPTVQAEVLRAFLREAARRGVDYNIIEAFDQPWKVNEGSVGPYWGMFDADGHLKFSLEGPITLDYQTIAATGAAIGVLLSWFGLRRRNPTLPHALLYALAANGFATGIALAAFYPFSNYMNVGTIIMWLTGVLMVVPLAIMTLAKVNEISEVLLGRRPQRLIRPFPERAAESPWPMISVHIPAYKEEPEMLKHTLDTCAALNYPTFEVLVIMNNTTDPYHWRPVADHCAKLNESLGREVFKFCYLPKVKGFKAGAMTLAYPMTSPDAEIIAVIDADYAVHPNWLHDLAPAFDDPKIALVQAPQDHRDGSESLFKIMMNWEYAGFFDIGMVQRNEDNAIVAHGTMLMIRRTAFDQVGGWSTDTIVEDTELGLRLFEADWHATYTNKRYGWGLLPDTFKAFKVQRHRWAYGAVQIIKKHWRHMLPGSKTLNSRQKAQFVAGWVYWLSDALGVAIAILNLIWVPVIVFVGMTLPMMALTVPILTAFMVNVLHVLLLYRKRVGAALPQIIGAAFAAMSLQLAVADAVLTGLVKDNLAFARTDKGGAAGKGKAPKARLSDSPVFWETILGLALLAAAGLLYGTNQFHITEQNVFAATIAVQALPFLSASVMRLIELRVQRKKS